MQNTPFDGLQILLLTRVGRLVGCRVGNLVGFLVGCKHIIQKGREAMIENERNNDYIIKNRRFLQQPIILTRRVGNLVGFREGCRVGARVVGFWVGWD